MPSFLFLNGNRISGENLNQVLVRPKILNWKKLKNMTINELSKEQFTELKWRYLDEIYQEETNENNTNELILSAGKKPDTNVYTNIK